MKISKIILNNLGPYEGENVFNFKTTKVKNIILFGGKNGAGKTSLFTAIRLCLYGCRSMGYDNQTTRYNKEIIKFINDNAKYSNNCVASVNMDIEISNGHEIDKFNIERKWTYNKIVNEELIVYKNGDILTTEQIYDFGNYIISIIPPDVFDLYFFDGEKIVDYFLNDDGNKNLKSAIMCISGFNIFNIMKENFERNQDLNNKDQIDYNEYAKYKESYENCKKRLEWIKTEYETALKNNKDIDAKIKEQEKKYKSIGGIDKEEWNGLLNSIQQEESIRTENNATLKRKANDILPFLLLSDLMKKLESQVNKEENNKLYNSFIEVFKNIIENKSIKLSEKDSKDIINIAKNKYQSESNDIHRLSLDETRDLIYHINDLKKSNVDDFKNLIDANKESLIKSANFKEKLENCSSDTINKYIKTKEKLLEEKEAILNEISNMNVELTKYEDEFSDIEKRYICKKNDIEGKIKDNSISNISTKSLLMIDALEKDLYNEQISIIKKEFSKNVKILMRKSDFINDIDIDDEFRITAYKNEELNSNEIIKIISSTDNKMYINKLLNIFKKDSIDATMLYLNKKNSNINIPVIVDFTKISNGEKQIFIMALYQAIISLSKTQVPFVIDTPFARTDTEHREKISKNFFPNLNGQVIILSTNEEIDKRYKKLMEEHIAKTYLLTNEGNKTIVYEDKYF